MASVELRAPFYDAAVALMTRHGYAGLKQAALCREVGVTTGAFYHSFRSWKEFTELFLEHWRAEQTTKLIALVETEPDPVERLRLLMDVSAALPHQAESAIRVWSALDPDVARVQAEVDRDRHAVVHDAFVQLVGASEAPAWTGTAMAVLVGFEQQPGYDPDLLRWGLQLLLDTATAR